MAPDHFAPDRQKCLRRQCLHLQPGFGKWRPDHGEVDLVGVKQIEQVVGIGLMEFKQGFGIGSPEWGKIMPGHKFDGGGDDAKAHNALNLLFLCSQLRAGSLAQIEDRKRPVVERLSSRCQADAAGTALKQRHTQFCLQKLHLVAERRL